MLLGLSGLCMAGLLTSLTLSQESDTLPIIMDDKLEYSQQLLEAIVFEEFHAVERIADELHLLSELSSWDVIRSPEYTRRSMEFQRVATRLAEVAADKNLDGLALGYVELTLQCFQCHRYMRETRRVEKEPDVPAQRGAWVR
jgi:hypothetical protein